MKAGQPTVVAQAKNCIRCRQDFLAYDRELVCRDCKERSRSKENQPVRLTPRQQQYAELVGQALTNKVIADKLHIRENSLKSMLSRLYTKLQLPNRTALALWACKQQQQASENSLTE